MIEGERLLLEVHKSQLGQIGVCSVLFDDGVGGVNDTCAKTTNETRLNAMQNKRLEK